MSKYEYYIFGYSDYIKNTLQDILKLENVTYLNIFKPHKFIQKILHRIFISKYSHLISKILMPLCKDAYWQGNKPYKNKNIVLIFYEINPLSNKQEWLEQIKKEFPSLKIVYIFTNIINKDNSWRLDQIIRKKYLYDLVVTFNKADADRYDLDYYEGVFSNFIIDKNLVRKAPYSDVYFCGLEKGRLNMLLSIYDYLTNKGINCKFDIILCKKTKKIKRKGITYHSSLINNEEVLANTIKTNCILEVLVDTTQPGSSLRMCESVVFQKKLLSNNNYIKDKSFYNEKQMFYFNSPLEIDINFIYKRLKKSDFLKRDILSPKKFLEFMEQRF